MEHYHTARHASAAENSTPGTACSTTQHTNHRQLGPEGLLHSVFCLKINQTTSRRKTDDRRGEDGARAGVGDGYRGNIPAFLASDWYTVEAEEEETKRLNS
eukprot:5737598-Pyramimonas_sp.AAC.1